MGSLVYSSYCLAFICFLTYTSVQAPYRHGDVILGGLFNVYKLPEDPEAQCSEIDMVGLGLQQAMIFAVEKINNDSNLLSNITLGYNIWDYCENITKAAQITYKLFKDECCTNAENTTQSDGRRKSIVSLIGPFESRTALYIGGFLRMLNVSAISGTTVSSELSSPIYSHLYRTVPSDRFLAKAMVDIIEHFNWSYVAAVGLDDSYGRNGIWSLVNEATLRESSFCIAMTEFIRHEAQLPSIKYIIEKLKRRENIKVVILWIYGNYLQRFVKEVKRRNLNGRIWIISEVYQFESFKENELFSSLEGSIGFEHHDFSVPGFKEHVKYKFTKKASNYFFSEWSDLRDRNCELVNNSDNPQTGLCFEIFFDKIYSTYVPYTIDAVYSVAHALDISIKDLNTNVTSYLRKSNINVHDMQRLLGRVNFYGETGRIEFDEFGDRGSASYDIFFFQQVTEASGMTLKKVKVGKWETYQGNGTQLFFHKQPRWETHTGRPPKSECSEQCPPGTRKSATSPCCWQCVPCTGGLFSRIPGSESCAECPRGRMSNQNKTGCITLPSANLTYASVGGSLLLAFGIIGVLVDLFSFATICKFWNSPIVKACNRELSLALLVTIISLFSVIFINVLEPTDTICKVIYPVRYLTYSLCLSLLLLKVLLISTAFQVPLIASFTITSLPKKTQVIIVIALQVILLLVLLPWLLLDPPANVQHIYLERYRLNECEAYKTTVGKTLFLLTCSYIFLQMFLSALCAFKIRNIPENFSESKRAAFSLYIFLFSLLCYHPVELSIDGWYVTVVDCVTTLLSAYGFLCCIFLPKIYILLFRPELNNLSSIRQEVIQFSFGSTCVHANPVFESTNQERHT